MIMFLAALLAAEAVQAAVPPAASVTKPVTVPAAGKPNHAQVLAAVKAEWPQHDRGNKGKLTPLEFGTWVMRSHGATVADGPKAKGIKPISAMNASANAFARADADHDGGVTPDEMTNFLLLPPSPTALQRAQTAAQTKVMTTHSPRAGKSGPSASTTAGN
jgi:hypothetical protein